jgi:hypothetical protein
VSEHDRENQPAEEEQPGDVTQPEAEGPSLEPPDPTPAPAAPLPAETETTVYAAKGSNAGKVIVGVLLVLALATVGTILVMNNSSGSDPAAARVPRTTDLFVQVTLEPSIEQQRAVSDLADRLPGGREMAEDLVDRALREMFEDAPGGLTYEEVEPWLGAETSTVVLIQSEDDEAARASLAKLPETEVVSEVVSGWAYLGENRAAIATLQEGAANDPLIRDRAFRQQRGKVGGDGIVLVRFDPSGLDELGQFGFGASELSSTDPGVMAIRMADEGIVMTAIGTATFEGAVGIPASMDGAPASSLGALSYFDVAEVIRRALPAFEESSGIGADAMLQQFGLDLEADFLSWLGGEFTFVVGNPQRGEFAVVIDATDPEAMKASLKKLRGFAALAGAGSDDFSVKGPDDDLILTIEGNRVRIKTEGTRLIVSPSPTYVDDLVNPASTLLDSPLYKRLLPGGTEVALQAFVEFDAIRQLIPSEAAPFFSVFDGIAMRGRYESGDQIFTLTLAYAE